MISALVVGMVEAYTSVYLGSSKGALALFVLEMLILLIRPQGIAGAVVTLFLANQLMHRFTLPAEEEALMPPPAPVVAHAPVTRPAVESSTSTPTVAIRQESTVTAPAPTPAPTQEVVRPPEPVRTPEPVHKTEPAAVTPAPVTTVAADIPEARRYASTWTNVRADRRNSASVLRVLRPGEAVQVDSLSQGWYRVTSHLQPAGYVDRRLLDTAPLPVSP
jgi:hypothetical protein